MPRKGKNDPPIECNEKPSNGNAEGRKKKTNDSMSLEFASILVIYLFCMLMLEKNDGK